jgi:hypothetical protein
MARGSNEKQKQIKRRFPIEQIGRELRKFYPAREKLPPQLSSLAKELEHKITAKRLGSH